MVAQIAECETHLRSDAERELMRRRAEQLSAEIEITATKLADIVVVGESSGGCLALGLAVMLDEHRADLPAGIAALSPMSDLEMRGASWLFNAEKDVADRDMGRRLTSLYIDDSERHDRVASPVRHHFAGVAPIFIGIGSDETMLSDAERTAFRADEAGVDVTLSIYEGMPHGFTRLDVGTGAQAVMDCADWCLARIPRTAKLE
ncbi:MAG TPA: alpha/beta hydrolase fold domain-containing protein [Burkholderiaceae bacterium]|nr:alpha/beta hydrolase fold domain-containing protein [Burkholderiaceae bacterium]